MNVRSPPFDNLLARRALNYAVDRAGLAQAASGSFIAGQTTCQLLPPNFPGYVPYCPYTLDPARSGRWLAPDLAKAQALVRESGTRGAQVTLAQPSSVPAKFGRSVAATLRQIGYRPRIVVLPVPKYFGPNQLALFAHYQVGVGTWAADYVSASDFLALLVTCGEISQNNNNGQYCNPSLDARIKKALADEAAQAGAASQEWTSIGHAVVDAAVDAPINNIVDHEFVARRVGNFQYNPQWGVLLGQLWVR